jgi:hypothetical protein
MERGFSDTVKNQDLDHQFFKKVEKLSYAPFIPDFNNDELV